MHPAEIASKHPDKPAYIIAETGQVTTFKQLNDLSNQGAQLFRKLGLQRGDHVAMMLENHPAMLQICLAAQRSGLHFTAISYRLQEEEVEYIVTDCQAKVFITSRAQQAVVEKVSLDHCERAYMLDGIVAGFESWEDAIAEMPAEQIADESTGSQMLYSSGTTGRPKGVLKPLPESKFGETEGPNLFELLYGATEGSIYLSPAPLYHAAPLTFTMGFLAMGVTVIVMQHFEAEASLAAIEKYRVTHSQWVPTMFVRLLDLPDEVKAHHDLSTHRVAVHAAAPCPVEVKQQMMEWWGPIIWEYYAGSEGFGRTGIQPQEWLEHPGSVGSADPERVFILDDDGNALPRSETGGIYFKPDVDFVYKGDPEKTAGATSPQGYITYGDVGHIDQDGYLYLTDRKSFMIISGGVNIYPREAEDVLIGHPAILDVGVFGIPHPDLGEEVKAAVELQPGFEPSADLETDIVQFCRDRLSSFKCPRSVDFMAELPRLPAGKLRKGDLRKPYWS